MEMKYAINVKDLKISVEFYSKFFSQKPSSESATSAEFFMREPYIHLVLNHDLLVSQTLNLEMELSSSTKVKLWANFLSAKNIEISSTKKIKTNEGEVVQFTFTDPDNYKWRIYSRN